MKTINEGINGLSHIQGFMVSEINTISGILYFLLTILILAILTSFGCFRKSRITSFCVLALNIFLEAMFTDFINFFIGIKPVRITFVLIQFGILVKAFLLKKN